MDIGTLLRAVSDVKAEDERGGTREDRDGRGNPGCSGDSGDGAAFSFSDVRVAAFDFSRHKSDALWFNNTLLVVLRAQFLLLPPRNPKSNSCAVNFFLRLVVNPNR